MMVNRLIWQFNPGDFHGDTQAMSVGEVGAYMLLMMTYWRVGSLPEDDASLRRITRTGYRQWAKMKPKLQPFFHDGWKHKRMESDLVALAAFRERQSSNAGGKRGKVSVTLRGTDSEGNNPLKSFNPTPATAPHSFKKTKLNSFFGTGQTSRLDVDVDNSASRKQNEQANPKPNKFQKAWMDALAHQLDPLDYAEAIKVLLADEETRDRITAAEIRERGSGVGAAVIAWFRFKKPDFENP